MKVQGSGVRGQGSVRPQRSGGDLLDELAQLRRDLRGRPDTAAARLGPLSLSLSKLVEQFPHGDPLDLGIRLLGALSDISGAVARGRTAKTPQQRHAEAAVAQAAVSEARYLLGLSQELGYGRPEQAISTIGRVDQFTAALGTT